MFTMPEWLDFGTHAARPAATAVAVGALYACSDHKLIYQSDGSSWGTWIDASGSGAGATNLQAARYVRSSGNYTITGAGSDSFADVDATNLALAITTGARRVLISVTATGTVNNAAGYIALDVAVDGTRLGAAGDGLLAMQQHATASETLNMSFTHVTDVLSAASHTFKLQWRQGTTAHTATLYGTTGVPLLSFAVVELYAA